MDRKKALRVIGLGGMREQIGVVFTLVTLIPLLASAYLVTRYVFPAATAQRDALAVIASTIVLCVLGWLILIGLTREVQRVAARAQQVAARRAAATTPDAAAPDSTDSIRPRDELDGLDTALIGIDETIHTQMRLLTEKANQVRFLMRSVEVANEELSSLHRMKSDIISLATHEFRNPLQTILETVSLFEDGVLGGLTDEQVRFVSHIGTSARTLERITGQMVMLAHLGQGAARDTGQRNVAGPILVGVLDDCRPLAERRRCVLELAECRDGFPVAGEKEDLAVALRSALGGLIRRVQPGGSVRASLVSDQDFARFSFEASPVDMQPEQIDRFVSSVSNADGQVRDWSGLGELELPLAKELVRLQGGSIAARSDPGRLSVSVVLPIPNGTGPATNSPDPRPRRMTSC